LAVAVRWSPWLPSKWTHAIPWSAGAAVYAEHVLSVLIPLVVLAILWRAVRHWILPFVLGFVLAVALGPSARPMIASAWATVANVGEALFGRSRDDIADPRERYPDRRGPAPSRYDDE
jgi:hypothetical protein